MNKFLESRYDELFSKCLSVPLTDFETREFQALKNLKSLERRFTAKDLEAAYREGHRDATNGLFTSELQLDKQWNNSEAKQKIDGC